MSPKRKKTKNFKISLPLNRYCQEVVELSCYKFLDVFYFKFSGDDKKIIVEAFLRDDTQKVTKKDFEKDFYTELNHNLIRTKIARENKNLREMVVFKTFFSALPEDEKERAILESEVDNPKFEDPLGIAIPWEQKHGKKNSKK